MESRKIDDQIRSYYAQQRPPAEISARIKQMIRVGAPPSRRRVLYGTIAAAIAVVVAATLWWGQTPQAISAAVARQAAIGHNEKAELEFRVRQCAELQSRMKSLDFTPVEPAMMQEMHMHIVGARYATLAGEIAAQIVYVDEHGVPCTLYEVRPAEKLSRIVSGDHQVDGLRISMWKEKGLVMVLARAAS
ncbi:MAG TPA: hypothetical protein VKL19_09895 [Thermoanaerobaculia bacterium]|nr:hypothetical protein [Thermoanaerobaculia bacterium]